jgi:hypothetical protein
MDAETTMLLPGAVGLSCVLFMTFQKTGPFSDDAS